MAIIATQTSPTCPVCHRRAQLPPEEFDRENIERMRQGRPALLRDDEYNPLYDPMTETAVSADGRRRRTERIATCTNCKVRWTFASTIEDIPVEAPAADATE